LPWVYTRRRIAERWGIPPWEVDQAPTDEVLTEIEIANIEAETRKR
jgi:hypothetical protein